MSRTSRPSAAFSVSTSSIASHITPGSTMKYSRKMKRFAFFSSSSSTGNISSPSLKYFVSVRLNTGAPAQRSRYDDCSAASGDTCATSSVREATARAVSR